MSKSLVMLASDLASFNNTSVDDALIALRSGLSGETEPLKRFGVALQDARLQEEALRLGLITTTSGVLPPAAKAQAAYNLIVHDTALAQGDMARTSEGLANQTRFLQADVTNFKATLGEALVPVMLQAIGVIRDIIPQVQAFAMGLIGKNGLTGAVTQAQISVYNMGKMIYNLIQWVIKMKDTIVVVAKVWVAVWAGMRGAAIAGSIATTIKGLITLFKALRTAAIGAAIAEAVATGGVSSLVGVAAGAAAFAGITAIINKIESGTGGGSNVTIKGGAPNAITGRTDAGAYPSYDFLTGDDVTPVTGGGPKTGSGGGSTKSKVKSKVKKLYDTYMNEIKAIVAERGTIDKGFSTAFAAVGGAQEQLNVAQAFLSQANALVAAAQAEEVKTRKSKAHKAAVDALNQALTEQAKIQGSVAQATKAMADETARMNAETARMNSSLTASNSWLAAQTRSSGPNQSNFGGFIEVPVIIDGQVVFRATQKYSLLNNRRNVNNGLAVSGSTI
jgi:hypothetical protein